MQDKVFEEMQSIVLKKGGRCLGAAAEEENLFVFECDEGHTWQATQTEILKGRWCPACKRARVALAEMEHIARGHSGEFLSEEYLGPNHDYTWMCDKDHVWNAKPRDARVNWCPECGKVRKKILSMGL